VRNGAANQKWGCRQSPDYAPDAPRRPQSNQKAGEWGLGWAELISGDWRTAISGVFSSAESDQSGIARGCGTFITGTAFAVMYMSYVRREAGGNLVASLYESAQASSGSTAGSFSI
jgi:hypothetical protein